MLRINIRIGIVIGFPLYVYSLQKETKQTVLWRFSALINLINLFATQIFLEQILLNLNMGFFGVASLK